MATPNLLVLARQGDEDAIATLLNQALDHKQISARVRLEQGVLQVWLHAPTISPSTVILVDRALTRLYSPLIEWVQVEAKTDDSGTIAWTEEFTPGLRSNPALSASGQAAVPTISSAIASPTATPGNSPKHSALALRSASIDRQGYQALLVGFCLAVGLFSVGFLNLLFRGFLVIVHEAGHAVTHWLFGRPALPTVNLLFGGGITLVFDQSVWVIGLVYLAIAAFAYLCRYYRRVLVLVGIATAVYTYCLATPTNMMLSIFMGHGMELVAIAACLFLSASGRWCRFAGDRAIYAMLGFFTLFSDVQFSWRLTHDADFRAWYEGGIGGMIDNDFVILADQYWSVNLSAIANTFLLGCFAAPILAFLLLRYSRQIKRGMEWLCQ